MFLLAAMWASSSTRSTREPSTPCSVEWVAKLDVGVGWRCAQHNGCQDEEAVARSRAARQGGKEADASSGAPAHLGPQVGQHDVVVGAARHEGEAALLQALRQGLAVLKHLQR